MTKESSNCFFERSEQAIKELDDKYGRVCHSVSYPVHCLAKRMRPSIVFNMSYQKQGEKSTLFQIY